VTDTYWVQNLQKIQTFCSWSWARKWCART